MKKLFPFLLLLIAARCYGQDKPVIISQKMFTPDYDVVPIDQMGAWYFHPGNDTDWAKSDISVAGWQKLSPLGLTSKYADKNGKVEGWFRIRIKLDSSVEIKGLHLFYTSFASTDIYLNGKLLGSYGSTGLYGRPYAEYDENSFDPNLPLNVTKGEQFTLALHIVDSLAPILPRIIKSQAAPVPDVIQLAGGNSERLLLSDYLSLNQSYSTWLSVSFTLCLLFWLLAIQNRRETVLFLIAGCSTFFVCYIYTSSIAAEPQTPPCAAYIIDRILMVISILLVVVSMPVVIAAVFKRRILLWIKICLVAVVVLGLSSFLLPQLQIVSTVAGVLLPLGLSLYYIISSWKNVKGAQWSIVAGLLASLTFMLLVVVLLVLHITAYTNYGIGYILSSGLLLSFPLSMLVYVALRFKEIIKEVRYNADKVIQLSEEKKHEALNRQKELEEEVSRQTAEIRANQARLIQSEKMASLGELTAGIAHEIQNPLNFVNNFSEVNSEMIDELKEELKSGHIEEAIAIADDVQLNEEKINHHGKRAEAIVKGMLQHSRDSSGQKEPTDLNALANEYMRLAYHGLRAKDKDFNADLVTHFDERLPKANVIAQDIGRVLLNIINNAFYAVQQKARASGADYKPTVEVNTTQKNGSVLVLVKDNGNGIPDAIKNKIMQPFFTTKPTGNGTGLGLSLSYEIVVKGHGGDISFESQEGVGTEFIVVIPVSS